MQNLEAYNANKCKLQTHNANYYNSGITSINEKHYYQKFRVICIFNITKFVEIYKYKNTKWGCC